MECTLALSELKLMGFSDPWPSNTMSKLIDFKDGAIVSLHVWVENGLATYVYFGVPKHMNTETPYLLLGIPPYKYPTPNTKEEIEKICFVLTGKSIYDINIKDNQEEKKEAEKWWNDLQNFKGINKNTKVETKRKWYQFI